MNGNAQEALVALLLSAREAAKSLRVSERTLWALTQPRGPIPFVRVGRRGIRYDPRDLVAWIDGQKRGSNAPR
jgi:excisionase family DNA binding protein